MANKIEADTALHRVFIPADLKKYVFFQCACDNLDFAENTRDGLTTHATSHMFDQYNNVEHNAGSIVGLNVPYADAQFY